MISSAVPYELSDYRLRKYFNETSIKQGWNDCDNVAVAVSGGGDSVALLMMFKAFFNGTVTALHVNHGIRGKESDDDENFTRELADKINAPFKSVKVNTPSSKLKGESTETAARRLRLKALAELAQETHAQAVMLGHNKNDLAETVIFNLIRGTGVRGIVGMTSRSEHHNMTFYRPLLGLRREFLRDILKVRGIAWKEDNTNNDDKYTRNFIRLKLLPMIESNINPSAIEHIAQFGNDMMTARNDEETTGASLAGSALVDDRTFDRERLSSFNVQELSAVIREIGRRLGLRTLSRNRSLELCRLIHKKEPFIFQWQGNFTVTGRKGRVIFDERS